jgi:hypothetical protein
LADKQTRQELKVESDSKDKAAAKETNDNDLPHLSQTEDSSDDTVKPDSGM